MRRVLRFAAPVLGAVVAGGVLCRTGHLPALCETGNPAAKPAAAPASPATASPAPAPAAPRARAPEFDPCVKPGCASKSEFEAMMRANARGPTPTSATSSASASTTSTSASATASSSGSAAAGSVATPSTPAAAMSAASCPPDRDELGMHSWNLLHTMAAYYPEKPTAADQDAMRAFLEGLARFYPCTHCRKAFQKDIRKLPPRLGSREEFSVWMCEQHNLVNEWLQRPAFPCTLARLDERWRDGHDGCWQRQLQNARESLGQAADDEAGEGDAEEASGGGGAA